MNAASVHRANGAARGHRVFRFVVFALWASLLLPFGSTYLGADSSSNLPACCRNDGKHHCAMAARLSNLQDQRESRFRGALEKCPYRPMRLGTVVPQLAQPSRPLQFHNECERYLARTAHFDGPALACQSRSHLKRGPPGSLFTTNS